MMQHEGGVQCNTREGRRRNYRKVGNRCNASEGCRAREVTEVTGYRKRKKTLCSLLSLAESREELDGRGMREGALEEEVAGGGMARKRHTLAIEMRGRQRGSSGSGKKFEATEGVSQKRDTPIVSLLEQGRDPPLLQTRDDGARQQKPSKGRGS